VLQEDKNQANQGFGQELGHVRNLVKKLKDKVICQHRPDGVKRTQGHEKRQKQKQESKERE
jgi:hypothetical protein